MSANCCSCSFVDTPFLANSCGAGFTLFMGLVELILAKDCAIADPCNRAGRDDFRLDDAALHDFIVVGAGAAGSVIAARLAEIPDSTVLLLEAGPEEPTATQLPAFAVSAIGSTLDWGFTTVPQENACLAKGGVCYWPRGKMISGTSGMQGMMYTRGHPSIYNGWEAAGNPGWGYDDVLPYFIRSENNQDPEVLDEGFHGFEGPLTVGKFPHHPPLAEAVVGAAAALGYREGDLNGFNQTGFGVAPMMVSNGLRGSTARLYLREAFKSGQLNVSVNSHVTNLIFDEEGSRVIGVAYVDKDGVSKTALAGKEVVLSAGAIGSPHLLLLSGVGPRADLEELNIPVVRDLPVGRNLHNHVSVAVPFSIADPSRESLTLDALDEFLRNRTGPMAGTGLTQTTGFMTSVYAEDNVPDLQVFFDGFNAGCSRTGLDEECTDGEIGKTCPRRSITARPTVIMPRSKGSLRLQSADPTVQPLLDPNYMAEPIDADILVDGIRLVISLTQTPVLQSWGFQLSTELSVGCEEFAFGSDDYWHCHVRQHTGAENHQGGSCKMGPSGDAEAVVDSELRVHGIENLRVVDASIFPYIPNSNPIAAIVMAAEKCADFIKATWA